MSKVECRDAKNFSFIEGQILKKPIATSSRDFRLTLQLQGFRDWQPGQFVMLRWGRHIIGRPFAIVDWQRAGESQNSVMDLWVRRLGGGTEELFNESLAGAPVSVTAPLGLALPVLADPAPMLFMSGGVGAASVFPILKHRREKLGRSDDFWIHGEREAQSYDQLLANEKKEFRPQLLYFESGADAANGAESGRITQALSGAFSQALKKSFKNIVACGPSAMLQALDQELKSHPSLASLPLWLGLEEKMACGIGFCFSCSVSTQEGLKRCCLEGPWFESRDLREHFKFRKTGSL